MGQCWYEFDDKKTKRLNWENFTEIYTENTRMTPTILIYIKKRTNINYTQLSQALRHRIFNLQAQETINVMLLLPKEVSEEVCCLLLHMLLHV